MFDSNSEEAKLDLPLVECDFRFPITHLLELSVSIQSCRTSL